MFWPPSPKMAHSFIQIWCWITLQVSHHQWWMTCVLELEGKTNFSTPLKHLMTWPDWRWPLPIYNTTDPHHWFRLLSVMSVLTDVTSHESVFSTPSVLSMNFHFFVGRLANTHYCWSTLDNFIFRISPSIVSLVLNPGLIWTLNSDLNQCED